MFTQRSILIFTIFLFTAALTANFDLANYGKSVAAQEASDPEISFKKLSENAENGDAVAQVRLGLLHRYGNGGASEDLDLAIKWFRKAADQGDASGAFQMGRTYDWAFGVPEDKSEAAKWYLKAAELGHSEAQLKLAGMFERGKGVSEDINRAVSWYQKAADQGEADAQTSLADLFYWGFKISKDYTKAHKWYLAAAKQGNGHGSSQLANIYQNGKGVQKNYREAVKWHKAALEQYENKSSYTGLGIIYATGGFGVEKDLDEAIKWYTAATELRGSEAAYRLGELYVNGDGAPRNLVQGYFWLKVSSELGFYSRKYRKNFSPVTNSLSPSEIAEAEKLAEEWLEDHK